VREKIMGKKNANNAIDFARLFAVKAKLTEQDRAQTPPPSPVSEVLPVAPVVAEPAAAEPLDALPAVAHEAVDQEVIVPVAPQLVTEETPVPESVSEVRVIPEAAPEAAAVAPALASRKTPRGTQGRGGAIIALPEPVIAANVDEAESTYLRIGMPRELHARVRAFAALSGQTPPGFVRDLFGRVTPEFDSSKPMAQLAVLARTAVPVVQRERRVDVRMQIPVTEDLHGRLQKFAALRGQTLGASMLDVLEAHAPTL
jgi:hypothetical protein